MAEYSDRKEVPVSDSLQDLDESGDGPTIDYIQSALTQKITTIKRTKIKPIIESVCQEYLDTYGEFGTWDEYKTFIFDLLHQQVLDKWKEKQMVDRTITEKSKLKVSDKVEEDCGEVGDDIESKAPEQLLTVNAVESPDPPAEVATSKPLSDIIDEDDEDIDDIQESDLICPLSKEKMTNPVDLDGITFDRVSIMKWIKRYNHGLFSKDPRTISDLVPNKKLHLYLKREKERKERAKKSKNIIKFNMHPNGRKNCIMYVNGESFRVNIIMEMPNKSMYERTLQNIGTWKSLEQNLQESMNPNKTNKDSFRILNVLKTKTELQVNVVALYRLDVITKLNEQIHHLFDKEYDITKICVIEKGQINENEIIISNNDDHSKFKLANIYEGIENYPCEYVIKQGEFGVIKYDEGRVPPFKSSAENEADMAADGSRSRRYMPPSVDADIWRRIRVPPFKSSFKSSEEDEEDEHAMAAAAEGGGGGAWADAEGGGGGAWADAEGGGGGAGAAAEGGGGAAAAKPQSEFSHLETTVMVWKKRNKRFIIQFPPKDFGKDDGECKDDWKCQLCRYNPCEYKITCTRGFKLICSDCCRMKEMTSSIMGNDESNLLNEIVNDNIMRDEI